MVLTDSGRCNDLPFKEMVRVCELLTRDCSFISDKKGKTRVSKEFVEQELKRKRAHPNSLHYTSKSVPFPEVLGVPALPPVAPPVLPLGITVSLIA